jgi:hypothetical protein
VKNTQAIADIRRRIRVIEQCLDEMQRVLVLLSEFVMGSHAPTIQLPRRERGVILPRCLRYAARSTAPFVGSTAYLRAQG